VLRNLWSGSLAFRRAVAALSMALAALVVYVGSNIPQAAALPNDEIDKLSTAHADEELRIYKPRIDPGGAALSLDRAANVGAEVWVQHAMLAGSSVPQFGALAPTGPTSVVYAAGDASTAATGKDCATSVTVSRADTGSTSPQMLSLRQDNTNRDDQQFRQLILLSPTTAMQVEVHTDSFSGKPCPRAVTLGRGLPIPVQMGPVDLLVPANEPITLLFSAIDPSQPLFSKKEDTFDGLSLGDGDMKADGFDVVSNTTQKTPILHAVAHKGTDGLTLHDLKLGAEQVALSVGEDTERADTWANGKRFPVFDLVDSIQKNPVLGFFLAAVLIPGLWKWIQSSCFPNKKEASAAD